jgi:hypothetical protein
MPNEMIELAALGLILGLTGGTYRRTDLPGGPNSQPDFEIDTGSRTIALEVTSTTVEEVRSFWDAVGKELWDCTKLTCGWSISLTAAGPGSRGAPVRVVRKTIEDNLLVLETADCRHFGPPHPLPADPTVAEAVGSLFALGVRAGGCIGPPPHSDIPARIMIGTTGPAGISDPAHINRAAENAMQANIDKLRHAQVDERQLFIWVDSTDHACFAPLSFGTLPADQPRFLDGIDKIWVAAYLPGPTVPTSVLWTVVPPRPWYSSTIRYQDPLQPEFP